MEGKQQVEKYFNDLSDDYLKNKYLISNRSFMSVRMDNILDYFDRYYACNEDTKVLDAGCGPGMLLENLFGRDCNVTGIDTSIEMLKLAKKRLSVIDSERSFNLMRTDIEKMPFEDNLFDMVVTSGVIEYLD